MTSTTSGSQPQPYKISVPSSSLSALKFKLDSTIFPDEIEDAGWDYGAPLSDIMRLVSRWRGDKSSDGQDGFDWRKAERELNQELPQFTRDINVEGYGTLNIHYVHKKSDSEAGNTIPLLFVHGWPGSFIEVRKILPLLTASTSPSFDVVALSLPGYGFSEAPKKKGFKLAQYAEVSHKLMLALGYNEYVTQGGDWGFFITREMASRYGGKYIKAWHTNFPITDPPSPEALQQPYTPAEQEGLKRWAKYSSTGQGYLHEQSTKPQTLGYGLTDSPVALLAWIYEKLAGGEGGYAWEDDEVLTWISIYWFSRAGPAASLRIYYEVIGVANEAFRIRVPVPQIPMGCSYFPKEVGRVPKSWYHLIGNPVFESEHTSGGHFAAHEKPELLVADLQKMFGRGKWGV